MLELLLQLAPSAAAIAVDGFDFIRGCTFLVGCPDSVQLASIVLSLYAHCCCVLLLLIFLLFASVLSSPSAVLRPSSSVLRYYLLLLKNVYPPQLAGKLDCNLLGRQIFLLLEYCIVAFPALLPRTCVGQVIMWADVDGIQSGSAALSGQAAKLLVLGITRRMRNAYT